MLLIKSKFIFLIFDLKMVYLPIVIQLEITAISLNVTNTFII